MIFKAMLKLKRLKKIECFKAVVKLKPQSGTCNAETTTAHQFPFGSEFAAAAEEPCHRCCSMRREEKKKLPFFKTTLMNVLLQCYKQLW